MTNTRENDTDLFIDIDTIGLRRSSRLKKLNDAKTNRGKIKKAFSLFAITASTSLNLIQHSLHTCYQTQLLQHKDFLKYDFDGTPNEINIIGQTFTSITGNECYTMKELLKQSDPKEFEKAMGKEVQAMFDNQTWRMAPM